MVMTTSWTCSPVHRTRRKSAFCSATVAMVTWYVLATVGLPSSLLGLGRPWGDGCGNVRRASTVVGLAGSGDLYVTCVGGRNGRFGQLLGSGASPAQALRTIGSTVEGRAHRRRQVRRRAAPRFSSRAMGRLSARARVHHGAGSRS